MDFRRETSLSSNPDRLVVKMKEGLFVQPNGHGHKSPSYVFAKGFRTWTTYSFEETIGSPLDHRYNGELFQAYPFVHLAPFNLIRW